MTAKSNNNAARIWKPLSGGVYPTDRLPKRLPPPPRLAQIVTLQDSQQYNQVFYSSTSSSAPHHHHAWLIF